MAFQLQLVSFVVGAVLLGHPLSGRGEDADAENATPLSGEVMVEPSARERPDLRPDPLVLPQWSEAEAAALKAGRPANLGGGLWADDLYPLEWAPPVARPSDRVEVPSGPLSAELLMVYQGDTSWCVDPQRLLAPVQQQVLEAQLTQLAKVLRQPLQLWVLAPGQQVPPGVLKTAARARVGQGGVAAMAWGEPASLQWAGVSLSETALAEARRAATRVGTPLGQLQETVHWLGAAVFRLQKEAPASEAKALAAAEAEAVARRARWRPIGFVLAAGLVASGAWVWWRRARPSRSPLYFPEQAVPARLAAPYSSGAGAAVRW